MNLRGLPLYVNEHANTVSRKDSFQTTHDHAEKMTVAHCVVLKTGGIVIFFSHLSNAMHACVYTVNEYSWNV